MHLDVPYTYGRFCLCLCMPDVISSFRILRAGSQVFALLILFLCLILHNIWSGNSLQLLCILPFGIWCLSAIGMMFVKIILELIGIVVRVNADFVSSVNCVQ